MPISRWEAFLPNAREGRRTATGTGGLYKTRWVRVWVRIRRLEGYVWPRFDSAILYVRGAEGSRRIARVFCPSMTNMRRRCDPPRSRPPRPSPLSSRLSIQTGCTCGSETNVLLVFCGFAPPDQDVGGPGGGHAITLAGEDKPAPVPIADWDVLRLCRAFCVLQSVRHGAVYRSRMTRTACALGLEARARAPSKGMREGSRSASESEAPSFSFAVLLRRYLLRPDKERGGEKRSVPILDQDPAPLHHSPPVTVVR